ncbi:hypothetical protein Ato02nite_046490 [Paractinoplanes toevensis]|uniref:Uncharacterized protein n=1 Tax=Paractinoplanes toevensis TaxID=571911 RepID=A0A919W8A6_9ACTN|nr:hypothetical protein Ato02nite_046490 [Actinoplanes toevensis]
MAGGHEKSRETHPGHYREWTIGGPWDGQKDAADGHQNGHSDDRGGERADGSGTAGETRRLDPRSTDSGPGDRRGAHELSLFTSGTRGCTCICRGESRGRGVVISSAPFRAGSGVVGTPGGRLNQS